MPRSFEEHRFKKTRDHEYVCVTWFERDRQNVRLETPRGRVIFDLWDASRRWLSKCIYMYTRRSYALPIDTGPAT